VQVYAVWAANASIFGKMEIKLRVTACDALHKYAKQKNIYAKIFLHFAAHCAIIDCIPLLCCRALPG
jgi:hypothetical protein